MRQYEKVFDALYVNLVEAGETGGILDTILQRLSSYIEKNVKLKRAVKSALVYPIAVLVVAASVIVLLLWKVVPIFATLFAGLGVNLPLADENRHWTEQFYRKYFRPVDFRRYYWCRVWAEVLVRHAGWTNGHRQDTA